MVQVGHRPPSGVCFSGTCLCAGMHRCVQGRAALLHESFSTGGLVRRWLCSRPGRPPWVWPGAPTPWLSAASGCTSCPHALPHCSWGGHFQVPPPQCFPFHPLSEGGHWVAEPRLEGAGALSHHTEDSRSPPARSAPKTGLVLAAQTQAAPSSARAVAPVSSPPAPGTTSASLCPASHAHAWRKPRGHSSRPPGPVLPALVPATRLAPARSPRGQRDPPFPQDSVGENAFSKQLQLLSLLHLGRVWMTWSREEPGVAVDVEMKTRAGRPKADTGRVAEMLSSYSSRPRLARARLPSPQTAPALLVAEGCCHGTLGPRLARTPADAHSPASASRAAERPGHPCSHLGRTAGLPCLPT